MEVAGDVDAVVARFWRLGEELGKAEPARRREVIRLFEERIELRFDQSKTGQESLVPSPIRRTLPSDGRGLDLLFCKSG